MCSCYFVDAHSAVRVAHTIEQPHCRDRENCNVFSYYKHRASLPHRTPEKRRGERERERVQREYRESTERESRERERERERVQREKERERERVERQRESESTERVQRERVERVERRVSCAQSALCFAFTSIDLSELNKLLCIKPLEV